MSYDRDKAVKYAKTHCNGWDRAQFPDYDSDKSKDTSDCANFVSQCLFAGGAVMQKSSNPYSDWWCERGKKGRVWAGAQSLRLALKKNTIQGIRAVSQAKPTGLKRGDIVFTPIREDRYKPKHNMRAGHVMILVEDYAGDFITVCQRGCPTELRYTKKKPDIANMIFYHIQSDGVENDSNGTLPSEQNITARLKDIEHRLLLIEKHIKNNNY